MSEQTRPLGAQISHMLKDRGVDVIFGIPGVHNQEMYRGIEEAGITHVLARHEQGAGFMADGYARATGKPGVAYVITGPGLCNIMTPMGQAYSDSVPMLVLSSCLDETAATRGQLHQMKDQEAAAGTVCDWSATAHSAQAAYALVDRALLEFKSKRPRSKHIQVPIAQLQSMAEPAPQTVGAYETTTVIDAVATRDIAQRLQEAKRPMFIFGGGCWSHDDYRPLEIEARALMRKSGAAAFTSYAGRGVLAADDPMNFGAYLGRPESAAILAQADLLITIGCELAEVDLWRSTLGHRCHHVRVDIDPEVLAQVPPAEEVVLADSNRFMSSLLVDLPEGIAAKWSADEIAKTRVRWRADVDSERPGIVPIVEALKAATPEGTMIYSDMTQFAYVAKEVWDMDFGGYWHHPTGFGTLGYATPAAIGGAVGRPDLPTMAIIGDYGFHYTMQELGVAVELGLSLPIILWDNGKLKEIEDSMIRAQIAPNAVVAYNPDFCALADAFGAHSRAPKDLAELQKDLSEAFAASGPTLIYVTPDILTR